MFPIFFAFSLLQINKQLEYAIGKTKPVGDAKTVCRGAYEDESFALK
jgi:hypothetical protein